MPKPNARRYLLLVRRPSRAARSEAARWLREIGATVVAQYGTVAVEADLGPDEVAAAEQSGLFAAQLKGPMSREHLERLNDEQRFVIGQWNTRFRPAYRKLTRDLTHRGKSWGEEGMAPPLAHTPIDPEDFRALIAEYEERTGQRLVETDDTGKSGRGRRKRADKRPDETKDRPDEPPPDQAPPPMTGDEFTTFERRLADTYKDETLAYHLARLAYRVEPRYRDLLLRIPADLLEVLLDRFFAEKACWEMTGEQSVGIVFVESSRSGGPKFSTTERNEICQEILDGLSWLAALHPAGDLSWVYDFQFPKIDVANGSGDPNEAYWRDPAIGQVTYDGNTYAAAWSSVAAYREDMRDANRSEHAFVIFVTPYANSWHAYASSGRITLANKNNWGGWGRGTLDAITAHETSHLYGSADEYTGSGTPCSSCTTIHGCDRIPNGNCGACARPHQDCVMDANSLRICGYTRGQIGWSHLFVETTTGDVLWAGTDDTVWIDIGDRIWELDTSGHDDRERGNVEGYPIWAPDLRRAHIKRILIRKSPDGFAGGWRLQGARVWFEGTIICDVPNINRWLEDEQRVWVGCVADRDLVNTLRVRVSTGDVGWAGTDDDVTLTLAGRDWNLDNPGHDDFERGHTDTFDLDPGTGFYPSGIHAIRIHKSPDGFAGGWRLKGVEVIVNGTTIYDNQSINQWLEDDHRTWSASF